MIILYHSNNKITEVISSENQQIKFDAKDAIALELQKLAFAFPDEKLVWCEELAKESLNLELIETLFHHNKMMLSFWSESHNFFDGKIGYVEESPFINVSKENAYPTWQMSSFVGVVHASLLMEIKDKIPMDSDFDYYLNSVAKLSMPLGLMCYSEPQLLKNKELNRKSQANKYTLFRFVKQHYRLRWVFLLFLNLFLYERKISLLPLVYSFFYSKRSNENINLDEIQVQSSKKILDKPTTLDVIIPTIGRSSYLYDVLKDFSEQTMLPSKIIIVEQNPDSNSISELDYIENETWPFTIQHFFIHRAGACHARNLALDHTESDWVFLADDDNRFDANLISDVFAKIEQFGNQVITTCYPQKNEVIVLTKAIQSPTFGAGNSFVRRTLLENIRFNRALEFGYGEDGDFGMQLRNQGHDILYVPEPKILHLKAPVGGFRTKPVLQWHNDAVQPKPSPTVMLYVLTHNSREQFCGFKTILFFKYYTLQKIKNPILYFINYRKEWDRSVFWANKLKNRNVR